MNHDLVKAAGGPAILQETRNKVWLPTDPSYHKTKSVHCGRHNQVVSDNLSRQMDAAYQLGKQRGYNQTQFKEALNRIMDAERAQLNSGIRALNINRRPWSVLLPGQI